MKYKLYIHYRRRWLCLVPQALGKPFIERHTPQRAVRKKTVGKELFAECLLSSTRQRLCRVPDQHSVRKNSRDDAFDGDGGFA
jgi:hypothetical protein